MRRSILLLMLAGAMLLACAGVVLAQSPGASDPWQGGTPPETPTDKIPDRYIVVLDDDASDPGEVARGHAGEHGLAVGFVYRHAIKGYSATIPNEQALERVRNEDGVKYV